ncbi:glycosyltransferase [Roseobacter sp. HKCCA0434]|uniref:glycosyltransferase n=1 Tax=Roseobacter sp. HKCCA0434 TaxID=3079297 RepID=UPI0029059EDF|nr:glycosyltransferase [Roseobacter sp. HKCCA0434]
MHSDPTGIDATLVVLAYGQEAIVHEAIASAFAQEFDGRLEILLSDDASPDGTYAVMERMAAEYDGPHTVALNRNPRNVGAIGHVNRVFELARGEMIVVNAGDDLSRPDRVARLWERFTARTPRPLLIHSQVAEMAVDGTPTGRILDNHDRLSRVGPRRVALSNLSVYGASSAWNRELFEIYGPMTELGAYGDQVATFRALLLDRLEFVAAPLVDYRMGGVSERAHLDRAARIAFRRRRRHVHLAVLRQRLADLRRVAPERRRLIRAMKQDIATLAAELEAAGEK